MDKNELHGSLVLVHPGLENDPANKQGRVGIIAYVNNKDEIFVRFGTIEGKYAPNALLRLKDRETLFTDLLEDASKLDLKDYKDLYKISVLQEMGRAADTWRALEIAGKNPAIWEKALKPVQNSIPLRMAQSIGR